MGSLKLRKIIFQGRGIGFLLIMAGITGLVSLVPGCYYDSKEYLYPVTSTACTDTVSPVKFSGAVSTILNQYCVSCHSGSNASGNVVLSTYAGVKAQVDNHFLLSSITHDGTVPPMPQGGGKLDDCKILAIKKWIDAGAPNN